MALFSADLRRTPGAATYEYGQVVHEINLPTLSAWEAAMRQALPAYTLAFARDLEGRIRCQEDGTPYRLTGPEGRELLYLVWVTDDKS